MSGILAGAANVRGGVGVLFGVGRWARNACLALFALIEGEGEDDWLVRMPRLDSEALLERAPEPRSAGVRGVGVGVSLFLGFLGLSAEVWSELTLADAALRFLLGGEVSTGGLRSGVTLGLAVLPITLCSVSFFDCDYGILWSVSMNLLYDDCIIKSFTVR